MNTGGSSDIAEVYAGASGFLFISFVADETGLTFEEEHHGEIFCQEHDEDDQDDD